MTTIKVKLDESFECSIVGHAGYAEEGKDIVCSAVSILSFSLLIYLESACDSGYASGLTTRFEDGLIEVKCNIINDKCREGIKAIMCGFELLGENYKKNVYFSPFGKES